ncbi:deoxyribonuclease-2-alpha isoform X3 [Mauremys mutica]|uniref:deoxyribonuclease-2-alpha isoform X3 n=1 Tax=Mauremys mutica TaxID=74926 RepID=UPI001D162C3A|nr:deoxyribonuclease-2-alpha isoform X3 [Mauremys mutica]
MDAVSAAEENARLQELIVEELAQAERWQGHYEGLLGRQARLHTLLQAQSLESLEQAARALRDELEEAQGALRERQEQSRRCHVHQREKENQRLAETIQELEGKVSKQRAWEKTHKQALQQLRVQGDELQRQLWDAEAKRQAKAERIREVLHGNITCWGDRVLEARQEAELFQREAPYGPLGTPPGSRLWEERVRDQTEKLLCQESGASGPRGRLPPRMLPLLVLAVALPLPLPLPRVAAGGVSCYDDAGQPVDWFLAYKLPRPRHGPPAEGMRYMYQDARSGGWVPGRALMNSTRSAVGRTLLQLYPGANRRTEDTAYILYNDQPPKNVTSSSSARGHTKGVVLLDRAQGFWLLHSTPHYPPPTPETYAWPHSGLHNGQSFLCVTFPYAQFKEIGTQLRFSDPEVFDARVQGPFAQDLPDLRLASDMEPVGEPPWNRSVALTSLGGRRFLSLAKFRLFRDDLYSGWVAQALSSDLYVQFWPNSRGVLPSNCSGPYRVYNIEELGFPAPGPHFSATVDHSKWCVSTEPAPGWTCVGDMNRNLEEEQRGGGTLCQQDPAVWKSYCALVQSYSKC